MKKAKMKCPYFVLLVVTSVLFTGLYQMKEKGLFAELLPFAWENAEGRSEAGKTKPESRPDGNTASEGVPGEAISEQEADGSAQSGGEQENGEQGNGEQEDDSQGNRVQGGSKQEGFGQNDSNSGREEESGKAKEMQSPEEYLSDALFIGDSRTSSLMEYAGWDTACFYVKYGLTIWDVLEAKIVDDEGSKISVEEALQKEKFGKIYIMLGINELGRGTPETFAEQYEKVIVRLRELQPDAVIVVEAIMHVTAEKDAEETYINNAEINARNDKLKEMAQKEKVCWLDVNTVTDEEESGCLVSAYSFDGVHLKVKYLDIWKNFILENQF